MTSHYSLAICHLYPREMAINGDRGNLLALTQRLRWRGIEPLVYEFHPGMTFPLKVDIILGGGGYGAAQYLVSADLLRINEALHESIEVGTPALVVNGMYQLFGSYLVTAEGEDLKGIGVFDMHTIGGKERLVGNVVVEHDGLGTILGYENHSGRTMLGSDAAPLGRVVSGSGNNGSDKTEGACYKHAIGTYLHGPVLPLNPQLCDHLIRSALEHKYQEPVALTCLEEIDLLTNRARDQILLRPR